MDQTTEHEKHPVAEALRSEIQRLAHEGDNDKGGTLTPDVLARIVRVAKNGRDLLIALSASPQSLASMVKRRRRGSGLFSPVGSAFPSLTDDDLGDSDDSGETYAPSPPSENFGMTALRELVSAAKNMNGKGTSPVQLVEAIAVAREKGLDDVAKDLESQLGTKKEEAPVAVPAVPQPGQPDFSKGA